MPRFVIAPIPMTRAFRRRLAYGAATIAALLILGAGMRLFLGFYMNLPAVCDQPCRMTDPTCSPLELSLELKDARARVKKMPRIWYRSSVKNVSCGSCRIGADFFHLGESVGISQANKEDFYFRVTDTSGNELDIPTGSLFNDGSFGVYRTTVPASSFSAIFVDGHNEVAGVEPYAVDESVDSDIFNRSDKSNRLELESGGRLDSQPMKYWPNRVQAIETATREYAGIGSARVAVQLNKRIAPEPPPGFRLLDRLVFLRAGRYRIQLAYNGKPFGRGHYRFEALPRPVAARLSWAYDWLGLPERYSARDWDIHAESTPLEVVVEE